MDDKPRLAATSRDSDYSLSIEETGDLYAKAGLPRDLRTIQRYCAKGRLECRLIEIPTGEKYFITPISIERHIAYIKEVRQAATNRGEPRLAATDRGKEDAPKEEEQRQTTTGRDAPRLAATDTDGMSRYVARLEGENEFLRGQITVKDGQISELTERAKETNLLIHGLQKMLTPLLGRPAPTSADEVPLSRVFVDAERTGDDSAVGRGV